VGWCCLAPRPVLPAGPWRRPSGCCLCRRNAGTQPRCSSALCARRCTAMTPSPPPEDLSRGWTAAARGSAESAHPRRASLHVVAATWLASLSTSYELVLKHQPQQSRATVDCIGHPRGSSLHCSNCKCSHTCSARHSQKHASSQKRRGVSQPIRIIIPVSQTTVLMTWRWYRRRPARLPACARPAPQPRCSVAGAPATCTPADTRQPRSHCIRWALHTTEKQLIAQRKAAVLGEHWGRGVAGFRYHTQRW
jgi:hypothetical protein